MKAIKSFHCFILKFKLSCHQHRMDYGWMGGASMHEADP